MKYNLLQGDCLEKMKELSDNTVDAIVTDPPYGLSFMGKKWDYDVPDQKIWEECLRVLKPGGYLLAFAGTRTQHRMAVRIEDAGFEIRDMIAWVYGSGFPKSLNIGKKIDQLQGNEREDLGYNDNARTNTPDKDVYEAGIRGKEARLTKGNSEFEGWGTALKPALEPITVARKPLSEKTVAENVLKWGTGGINIDESRVGTEEIKTNGGRKNTISGDERDDVAAGMYAPSEPLSTTHTGRFPANLIHDGSDEVVGLFPQTKGGGSQRGSRKWKGEDGDGGFGGWAGKVGTDHYISRDDGTGSASRFFYCAKASKSERNKGCEGLPEVMAMRYGEKAQGPLPQQTPSKPVAQTNHHPTVKPIALMEYLVNLVSREGATCLDPFMGSGSTGVACKNLNRRFIGIELDPEYFQIAKARIEQEEPQATLFEDL